MNVICFRHNNRRAEYGLVIMNKTETFSRCQSFGEVTPNGDARVIRQRHEDSESFVLELEDYLHQNKIYGSNIDHTAKTDGISFDISKMSMKGYTDDPYLPPFNGDINNYQIPQQAIFTPLQSSLTSSLGTSQSDGSSYWSSSPDTSGTDESNTTAPTYLLLPSSCDSFQLSYDVNSSATADQILVHSSSVQGDPVKLNKMIETVQGER